MCLFINFHLVWEASLMGACISVSPGKKSGCEQSLGTGKWLKSSPWTEPIQIFQNWYDHKLNVYVRPGLIGRMWRQKKGTNRPPKGEDFLLISTMGRGVTVLSWVNEHMVQKPWVLWTTKVLGVEDSIFGLFSWLSCYLQVIITKEVRGPREWVENEVGGPSKNYQRSGRWETFKIQWGWP